MCTYIFILEHYVGLIVICITHSEFQPSFWIENLNIYCIGLSFKNLIKQKKVLTLLLVVHNYEMPAGLLKKRKSHRNANDSDIVTESQIEECASYLWDLVEHGTSKRWPIVSERRPSAPRYPVTMTLLISEKVTQIYACLCCLIK